MGFVFGIRVSWTLCDLLPRIPLRTSSFRVPLRVLLLSLRRLILRSGPDPQRRRVPAVIAAAWRVRLLTLVPLATGGFFFHFVAPVQRWARRIHCWFVAGADCGSSLGRVDALFIARRQFAVE